MIIKNASKDRRPNDRWISGVYPRKRAGSAAWILSLLAVAGCQSSQACRDDACPDGAMLTARELVSQPLLHQAQNGLILAHTIWDEQFEEETDQLLPSGRAKLDRLARRGQPYLELYLQEAEVEYRPEQREAFAEQRKELNAQRREAIREYLAATRPELNVEVNLLSAQTPGMHGFEADRAIRRQHANTVGSVTPPPEDLLAPLQDPEPGQPADYLSTGISL